MRFVFLTLGYHPDLDGGAWRYATEIAEGLANRGAHVDVVCPHPHETNKGDEIRRGVHLHWFDGGKGGFFARRKEVNRRAADTLRSITHSADNPFLLTSHHAYLTDAFFSLNAPRVAMFHGPWSHEFLYSKRAEQAPFWKRLVLRRVATRLHNLENRTVRRADQVFVVSQHFKKSIKKWHGPKLPPLAAISGGADFDRFKPMDNRDANRERLGLKPNDFLFLTLRRLDVRMGLRFLLNAFRQVADEFPNAKLWMAGRGPLTGEIQSQIEEFQLQNQARLLGYVDEAELPSVLGSADCTVMPSLDLEGFGLATVESLGCGTPVIGSSAGANPELLSPLRSNLIFKARDHDSLVEKLREVLRNPTNLPSRGECRSYATRQFSWDRPLNSFESTWRTLATKAAPSKPALHGSPAGRLEAPGSLPS